MKSLNQSQSSSQQPAKPLFLFGAASSAHQVEGHNTNSDWWSFEQKTFKDHSHHSGKGTDHYQLFDEDFTLAHDLGHNCHRFSIEWAKIEPEEGLINQDVIKHYHEVFKSLKKHRLTPVVTFHHTTIPLWFERKGGFENRKNFQYFIKYCKLIAQEFKDDINYVILLNETVVMSYNGYLISKWPPLKKGWFRFIRMLRNFAKLYNQTYKELKKIKPEFQISVASNNLVFSADRKSNIFDVILRGYMNYRWNHFFLDMIKKNLDFIGLNYYFHRCVRADSHLVERYCNFSFPSVDRSDLDWEIYPEGIYEVMKDLSKRYKKPILITENGVADHKDLLRQNYIPKILNQVFKAHDEGIPVFGYIHWSLTDNFEWDEGYKPRFGLIEINYNTYERMIRPSALIYKKLIHHYLTKLRSS